MSTSNLKNEQETLKTKSLYELALCIGSSLDLAKNSELFFAQLASYLNLRQISVWQEKGDLKALKHSFSKNETIKKKLKPDGELYAHVSFQVANTIEYYEGNWTEFPSTPKANLHCYKFEEIFLIFTFIDAERSLSSEEQSELIPLFQKYVLSVKASLSHEYLLNEMVRRQRAENQLYRQELLYRFGANSLTEGLLVINLESKITFVNNAIKSLTGKSKPSLIGSHLNSAFRAADGSDFAERIINAKSRAQEIELLDSKNEKYWGRISISDFIDASGKAVGFIVTVLDVTDSSKARRETEQSRKELKDLIDNIYDAILVLSEKGIVTNFNKAAKRLTSHNAESFLGLSYRKLIHPDDLDRWEAHMSELRNSGYNSGFEGRIIGKNGDVKLVEVNSTAIFGVDGFIGSREILRDITDRKELEAQREISEKKLRLIIDQALDAVVTLDINGRVVEWNQKAEDIFKIKNEEAKGEKLEDLIFADWQKQIYSRAMSNYSNLAQIDQLKNRVELIGTNRDGVSFPIEFSVAPIRQGDLTFYSAFIRDITERKKTEEETTRLLEELGTANQELKDFAYIVSHDLKAPLRSVGSLADWLIQDFAEVLNEEGNMLLTLLRERIRRMHNLIEGVLQYSKLGRIQNEKELIKTDDLLAEIIDLLDPPSTCEVNIQSDLPEVLYDKVRLQQVFQNLLSNAIKFLDKPKGEISITMKTSLTHYIFSVTDNGPGIDENHFNKVFQIFQTLQARDEYESTGIGLSIVKRIVELNDGTVSVESTLGKGTTFSFSVPKHEIRYDIK